MRENWHIGVKALMIVIRILPEDLYHRVRETNEELPWGANVPGRPHMMIPGMETP